MTQNFQRGSLWPSRRQCILLWTVPDAKRKLWLCDTWKLGVWKASLHCWKDVWKTGLSQIKRFQSPGSHSIKCMTLDYSFSFFHLNFLIMQPEFCFSLGSVCFCLSLFSESLFLWPLRTVTIRPNLSTALHFTFPEVT